MSADASNLNPANASAPQVTAPDSSVPTDTHAAVPKKTVCNEKNEKGKLCNGHLKQLRTAGEDAEVHLRGDDVLFKCQTCGTLYMGPPLGHLRDPDKQHRFVQAELTALLQAAGGTMPIIKKNERGVYVLAEALAGHAQAPAKPVTATPATTSTAPVAPADSSPQADAHRPAAEAQAATGQASAAPLSPAAATASPVAGPETPADLAPDTVTRSAEPEPAPVNTSEASAAPKPAARKASGELHRGTYCGVVDTGPVPGETGEQKIARLTKLAAAAKQRAEEGAS